MLKGVILKYLQRLELDNPIVGCIPLCLRQRAPFHVPWSCGVSREGVLKNFIQRGEREKSSFLGLKCDVEFIWRAGE